MTKDEKTKKAKELAEALDAARMENNKAAMKSIRKKVRASDLVWEVNQITGRLLSKHASCFARDFRAAAKNKDVARMNELSASSKEYLEYTRVGMRALCESSQDNPGKTVF